MYTIGEISEMFGLPVSTLRYYDKQGMFKNIKRESSGIRKFGETEISTLNMIECLKKAGMQLTDIKTFLDWCSEGESTLEKRKEMFYNRKADVEKQMQELQKVLDIVKFKCWYYDVACADKSEENVQKMMKDGTVPKEFHYETLFK